MFPVRCNGPRTAGLVQAGYPGVPGWLPWSPELVTLESQAGYPGATLQFTELVEPYKLLKVRSRKRYTVA
jgi:hypothetical protein